MGVRRDLWAGALSVLRLLALRGLVCSAGGDSLLRPRALLLIRAGVRLLVMLDELLRSGGLFDAEFRLRQLWSSRDGSVEWVMRHSDVRIDAKLLQWLLRFVRASDVEAGNPRRQEAVEGSGNESGRLNDDGDSQCWDRDR